MCLKYAQIKRGEMVMDADPSSTILGQEAAQSEASKVSVTEPGVQSSIPVQSAVTTSPTPTATAAIATGTVTDAPRVEVSAATITRMMGIASTTDLRLLEGRVDLLASKVTGLLTKVDRVLSMFGSVPTSSDIGRLELQMGAVKSMLRELLESTDARGQNVQQADTKGAAEEQNRKLREGIRSSSE